jgi:calcineurin-like phosphoesterase family protein
MPAPPTPTLRHPALSLWQSLLHRTLAPGEAGLHASAEHPAMVAATAAARALDTGVTPLESDGNPLLAGAALYARLVVARFEHDHAAAAKIEDELRYSIVDPLWAELLVQYEKSRFADAVDSYPRHRTLDDFILAPMPDDVTIALVADWATGTPSARAILEQIATQKPDIVIHLGDVYFSGLPDEVRTHFVEIFDAVFGARWPRVLSLAGNHDRYSGGRGFLELLSKLDQPASYFCLQNKSWQLLAMDTGYHDRNPGRRRANITELEETEVAYHLDKARRFGGERGTILLSHHQLFSSVGIGRSEGGDPLAVNPKLHAALASILGDVAWWFWGHEHNLSIFAPYAGLERGRGIGSGAIPVLVEQHPYTPVKGLVLPEGESGPPAPLPGTQLGHDGVVYNHAFAMLRLEGRRATASYYQSDTSGAEPGKAPALGAPLFTETVTLPARREG